MITPEDLFPFDPGFGYLGILIITFVVSIIPFIPVPYFPLIITAAFNKNLDPHMIALVGALGTTSAKIIIFLASYYGRKMLSDNTKKRMMPLQRLVSRYGWPGAFVAALTPIPDDLVYIPLGLAKYKPWKFATATFAGKFLMHEVIVWGAVFLGRPVVERLIDGSTDPTNLIIAAIASIAALGVIVYFSLKIDWEKVIGKWAPWALRDNGDSGEKKP